MRFVTDEVIPRPAEEVWVGLADFAGIEAAARARGVEARRIPGTEGPEPVWTAEVPFRGRDRHVEVAVARMTPPLVLDYRISGSQLVSTLRFGLEEVAAGRTRLAVTLEVGAEGVSGRMLLQSLKLVRATLLKRFRKRIGDYAQYLARHPG